MGRRIRTKGPRSVAPDQLARHWHQLRSSHGTVLLGDPARGRAAPRLEPAWFVSGCPLEPDDAVEVIRKRHGFASRTVALRALRKARDDLREKRRPEAKALDDLP